MLRKMLGKFGIFISVSSESSEIFPDRAKAIEGNSITKKYPSVFVNVRRSFAL
jgi:hypothetical protein